MKQILLILVMVALAGCGNKEAVEKPESPKATPKKLIVNPIVEKAIRQHLKKPKGELTEADLEKVTKLLFYGVSPLTDVKSLEKLTQLKELHLPNNQLTDVKGLEKLTQLTYLDLSNNQLTDVKGLENLTQLKELFLFENQLTDVKGLERLTQLEALGLIYNKLIDLKGLEKLTQLTRLSLGDNPGLTKAQIDELQKALPKCDISSNPTK